jgi:hypothetical protein
MGFSSFADSYPIDMFGCLGIPLKDSAFAISACFMEPFAAGFYTKSHFFAMDESHVTTSGEECACFIGKASTSKLPVDFQEASCYFLQI